MRKLISGLVTLALAAGLVAPAAAGAAATSSAGTVAFDVVGSALPRSQDTFTYSLSPTLCAPECTGLSLSGAGRWAYFLGAKDTVLLSGLGGVVFHGEYLSFGYELALVGTGPLNWTVPGVAQGYFLGSGTAADGTRVTVGGTATGKLAGPGIVRSIELIGSLSFAGAGI